MVNTIKYIASSEHHAIDLSLLQKERLVENWAWDQK